MRWIPWVLTVGLLWMLWTRERTPQHAPGWETICVHAPFLAWASPPAWLRAQLAVEGMQEGLRGWEPTAAWINEQCTVLQPAMRRPNRHSRR